MTLQVSNIAGDGRHVVKPRDFPRHAEVYAPPDNWRGMKARKDYREPGYNRDTVLQLGYRRKERRRDAQVTSIAGDGRHMVTPCGLPDGHCKQAGYRRDTLQGVGLQEGGWMG